jgi:hypothetical protein
MSEQVLLRAIELLKECRVYLLRVCHPGDTGHWLVRQIDAFDKGEDAVFKQEAEKCSAFKS